MLGGVLTVVADRQCKEAGATVEPFEHSTALVTDGVIHETRNPIYLWMVASLIGGAMQFVVIVPEECMLAERFGEHWESYSNRVRHWIGPGRAILC